MVVTGRLCKQCSSLGLTRRDFVQPPFEPEDKYHKVVRSGLVRDLKTENENENKCGLCRLLLYALLQNESERSHDLPDDAEWTAEWMQNTCEYDPVEESAEDRYGSGLYPGLTAAGGTRDYCVQLVDEADTTEMLRGRLIEPQIDVEIAKGWVEHCKEQHGDRCPTQHININALDCELLCIDVREQCLRVLPRDEPYLTLSYLWGQNNYPRLMHGDLDEWQQAGALGCMTLPATIADAIALTKKLGYNYLWVDSLCIVQDDEVTKTKFIEQMDSIYGNSELTLVAGSGMDAHAGLSGINPAQERHQQLATLSDDLRLGVLPNFDVELMRSPHATRGWTYQEGVLSPRCLVFLNGQMYFSCRAAVWREDVMAETSLVCPFEGANTFGRTQQAWPLRRYEQHVTAYTSRTLTFESDIVHAFAGVQCASSPKDWRNMWYAMLPGPAFDWAILWSGAGLERRSGFPSWSWVGWKGYTLMATDHWSAFDQKWLRTRTWIDWYVVEGNSSPSPIWTVDDRNASAIWSDDDGIEDSGEEAEGERPSSRSSNATEEAEKESIADDEPEAFPTYGHPEPNNIYGRQLDDRLDFLNHYRTSAKIEDLKQLPPSSKLDPSYLRFESLICSFRLERAVFAEDANESLKQDASLFVLKDDTRTDCGLVQLHIPFETATVPEEEVVQVILLSYAAPGTAQMFPMDKLSECPDSESRSLADVSDAETVLGEMHTWDRLNVLVVRQVMVMPLRVERIGVGVVYKNSVERSIVRPQWKAICLH